MKHLKLLLIISILCCCSSARAQSLEESDIRIFVTCEHEIGVYMDAIGVGDVSDDIWDYSMGAGILSLDFSMKIFRNTLTRNDLEQIKAGFRKYMAAAVPPAIEEIHIKNGWAENGHEKQWTIYFMTLSLATMDKYAPDDVRQLRKPELLERLSQIFHKDDVALVDSNYKYIVTRKDRSKAR